MTPDEVQRINQWLRDKHVRGDCPACGVVPHWKIYPEIMAVPIMLHAGTIDPDERHYGFLGLGCTNCAYTMLFGAVSVGLAPPWREKAPGATTAPVHG